MTTTKAKKRNWGGRRSGAGRPVRRFYLRLGDKIAVNIVYPDGTLTRLQLGEVTELDRKNVTLQLENGDVIHIVR